MKTPKAPKPLPPVAPAVAEADTDSLSEQVVKLLAQFGPGAGYRVRVDRRRARGEPEYLGTIDLTLDLEDVAKEQFGGGDFRGRVVDAQGAYQTTLRFSIAGAPRDMTVVEHVPRTSQPEAVGDVLLRTILDGQRAIADALKELARSDRGGGGSSLDEVLKVAQALKAVANDGPKQNASEMLAIVDRVMGLREKILESGGDAAQSEIGAVVRDGVRPLLELGREYLQTRREVAQAQAGNLKLIKSGPAAAGAAAGADPVAVVAQRIPPFARTMLVSKAARNADPELYAEFALDQLSGDDQDALAALLESTPDFADRFCAAIPEFQPHAVWFGAFAEAMRDLLTGEGNGGQAGADGTPAGSVAAPPKRKAKAKVAR